MRKASDRFSGPRPIQDSEEMKAWAAALTGETATWPLVHSRNFFGFTALYREDKIFALLPRTRALEPPNSIAFKLESAGPRIAARARRDSRIGYTEMQKARWFTFALTAEADLRDALGGCYGRTRQRLRSFLTVPCDFRHTGLLFGRTFELS